MVSVSIKVKKPEILVGQFGVEIVTFSVNVFASHLRKREKTLATYNNMYSFILVCILKAPHNLHNLIHIVKCKSTTPIHSFLVREQWMVWALSGHCDTYFLSFHVKIDIFNFSFTAWLIMALSSLGRFKHSQYLHY
jgi:hypothetical protein